MTAHQASELARELRARFEFAGAEPFDCDVLQPADTLLDLYGEDIRGRAYVTTDPIFGERMLRPDFTVPLVQTHMANRREPARYTYAGKIFRKQDVDPDRLSEYYQVGFEIFGGSDPAANDAEVFAAMAQALDGLPVHPVIGDIGVLSAAVDGLTASETRKAALRRHIWRPKRFKALLDRYAGLTPADPKRVALLDRVSQGQDVVTDAGPAIGLRRQGEVDERLKRLVAEAAEPAIPAEEVAILDQVLSLSGTAQDCLGTLEALVPTMTALEPAVAMLAQRLTALERALVPRGWSLDTLAFATSFGRTTLEYYDGFVFGFLADGHPDWSPVASGGRFDALTRVLGHGRTIPAVGGVIRPELVLQLRAEVA